MTQAVQERRTEDQIRGRAAIGAAILALAASTAAAPASSPAGVAPPTLQAPFVTPLPWLLHEGASESNVEAAVAFDEPPAFGGSGGALGDLDRRSLTVLLSRGLGERVEGSARIGVQSVSGDGDREGPVATDLKLEAAYAFLGGFDSPRALTARLTAKAPTAPDQAGAGTDEADLGLALSAGTRTPRAGLFGSVGVELLGNPLRNGAQDDVATYGAGLWLRAGRAWDLTGEVEGRAFSRFDNSAGTIRLGARRRLAGRGGRMTTLHAAALRGLNEAAPRWGLVAGISLLSR